MKFVSVNNRFFLYCFFCCLLGLGLSGISVSIAGENTLDNVKPGSGTSTTTPALTDESDLDIDPYDFNNLDDADKTAIKEDQVKQKELQKEAGSLRDQGATPDELYLQFQEKRENIRLYEILALSVMSICALGIVLTCMKNSQVCNARDMLNATGLILVIFSTVMVIIVATVDAQLTAAMGVLGGIAGYLFGTFRSTSSIERDPSKAEPGQKKSLTKD